MKKTMKISIGKKLCNFVVALVANTTSCYSKNHIIRKDLTNVLSKLLYSWEMQYRFLLKSVTESLDIDDIILVFAFHDIALTVFISLKCKTFIV